MRYVWPGATAVILIVSLSLVLGSSRPFERVPAEDQAYSLLQAIGDAGLLADFTLPAGELSRLEFAVLVQRGLACYGGNQLDGQSADVQVEDALDRLLVEFADELSQIGSLVTAPARQQALPAELERRISLLEEDVEEEDDYVWRAGETYLDQLYACDCDDCTADEPALDVSVFGDIYLQGRFESTTYTEITEDYEYSDLDIYWGELGVEATDGTWSGRFSVLLNDEDSDDVTSYEYFGRYRFPASNWFLQAGQVELPWSNNYSYFPTYSAAYDLGLTNVATVGLGLDEPGWGFSAWAFNPEVEVDDEEDHFTDYAAVWDITRREAEACRDGWALRAGYTSHLAEDRLRIAGPDSVVDRTAAINLFGRYDWGGNRYHLLAGFTHSLDEFNPADLDADGDAIGDQPCALNTEFVYEPRPDRLWGISFQKTCELADYAETRYGLLFGKRLSELASFKLEYTHGEYGDFVTAMQDSDETIVAELNLAF
jgi:hypothetical protein